MDENEAPVADAVTIHDMEDAPLVLVLLTAADPDDPDGSGAPPVSRLSDLPANGGLFTDLPDFGGLPVGMDDLRPRADRGKRHRRGGAAAVGIVEDPATCRVVEDPLVPILRARAQPKGVGAKLTAVDRGEHGLVEREPVLAAGEVVDPVGVRFRRRISSSASRGGGG